VLAGLNGELMKAKQSQSSLKRSPTPHHTANLQNEIEVRDKQIDLLNDRVLVLDHENKQL
jgi:hypothetical protein